MSGWESFAEHDGDYREFISLKLIYAGSRDNSFKELKKEVITSKENGLNDFMYVSPFKGYHVSKYYDI